MPPRIKAILLTLNKGTSATKSQQTAMKALGLDAVKLSKAMQVDGSGTIVDVLERIRKLPKDQQAASLSELFGTESVGAIAPLLTNLDALKERLQLVGDRGQYSGPPIHSSAASRPEAVTPRWEAALELPSTSLAVR